MNAHNIIPLFNLIYFFQDSFSQSFSLLLIGHQIKVQLFFYFFKLHLQNLPHCLSYYICLLHQSSLQYLKKHSTQLHSFLMRKHSILQTYDLFVLTYSLSFQSLYSLNYYYFYYLQQYFDFYLTNLMHLPPLYYFQQQHSITLIKFNLLINFLIFLYKEKKQYFTSEYAIFIIVICFKLVIELFLKLNY